MIRRTSAIGARCADDRGSIALAMLLIMIGTMLAGLLVPVIVAQANNSRYEGRRNHAYDAAQSGIEIMLGKIRDANNGSGVGVRGNLPCTVAAPLTGAVSASGNERFQAWVYYFARDPHGHDDWLTDTSKQIQCTSGSGTSVAPAYAIIKAQGTDNPDGSFTTRTRTVQATYTVKTKNTNLPGGLIYSYDSHFTLCLDAGSSSPAAGTIVTLQKCSSGLGSQTWAFNSNVTMSLTASADSTTGDLGMCLDAAYPRYLGEPLTVQPCASTTSPEQQFSPGLYSEWHSYSSTNHGDGYCWNTQSPNTVGTNIIMGGCDSDPYKTYTVGRIFLTDQTLGNGGADAAHGFLVNYGQFGRCIGQTYGKLYPGPTYDQRLYVIQCTVSADPTNQPVSQQFNFPMPATGQSSATGQITSVTKKDGQTYCLISPMQAGGYPYVDTCSSASAAATTWKVWTDTGDYGTSYRITDGSNADPSTGLGYCLSAPDTTDAVAGDANSNQRLLLKACSSSTLQKWNAPPGILSSPVSDYHER